MKIACAPENEAGRLAALRRYQILDTAPEPVFDKLVELAAYLCEAPIAAITLIDANRQWFKSVLGLDVRETSRDLAFCAHAILARELLVVPDARRDGRFADNPLVTGPPGIRFYAGAPLIDAEGHALGTVCVLDHVPRSLSPLQLGALRLIGDQVMAQIASRLALVAAEAEVRIAATAFESQEGILITDARGTILRANQAFTAVSGYAPDEVVGRNPRMLRSGRHDAAFYAAMWEELGRTGSWKGEIWNRRKNGEVYAERLIITAVRNAAGAVANYVATYADVTMSRQVADEIERLAFYDQLTNLPNRRLLLDRLRHALSTTARSLRHGALLFIDLDNFKTLNDTMGHDVGDRLLQQVAQRLASCMRQGDTVARIGGDEFMVLLLDLAENELGAAEQTETVGEKIRERLGQPYRLGTIDYQATPSIGAAVFRGHGLSADELIKQSDIAMYQAKRSGRNALRFFDPQMQASISARAAIEQELRLALERGEFQLHFQAQVDDAHRPLGAEVLLRWQHPVRGLVAPADFIPLAEETGLIVPIGRWVLEAGCRQVLSWSRRGLAQLLTLSVNVSAREFHQDDFVHALVEILDRTGVDPRRLKIELTESVLLDDVEEAIARMAELKALGVRFSLDDFGTGYSSLSYLKRLPLDEIKIDLSFTRNVLTNATDAAIARTLVMLARTLGLQVIAEGVETGEQREFFARCGVSGYQGYLFGRPLGAEAFSRWLGLD